LAHSFHGYEVQEQIGAGGMSTVFKGVNKTLGFPVAIKVLHPALSMDPHFIARFEREARAAANLAGSNIARVFDYGQEGGVYFIVMEYVDGQDLGQVFKQLQVDGKKPVPFPVEVALLLLEEIAFGLSKAHEQNIIHRDIKPSNVLLNSDGEIKLVDFGLARDVRRSPDDFTRTGMVIGTPSYMSPEQAVGGRKLDARSDIFSLGVVAYQFITGEKPFHGETASAVQEIIIHGTPQPLTLERCPLLTPEIEAFVSRCLAKDPDKRYQTMKRVMEALATCIESIEAGSDLVRQRRTLMAEFAADPRALSLELKKRAISIHLKRGFHYKSMGREKLGDAERALRVVVSLDPGNKKAREALGELAQPDETVVIPGDASQEPPGRQDPTRILDPAARARAPEPPVPPGVLRRRRPLVTALFLLVLVVGAGTTALFIDQQTDRSGNGGAGVVPVDTAVSVVNAQAPVSLSAPLPVVDPPAVVEPEPVVEPPAEAEPEPVVEPPAEAEPEPQPVVEPSPPAPPATGWLVLDLPEQLDVYIDGKRVRSGRGHVTLEVEPAAAHHVEVRNHEAHARMTLGTFQVEPGQTRRLDPVLLQYGSLVLKANAEVTVRLGDAVVAESVRDIDELRVGAGQHELTITAPEGYKVGRVIPRLNGVSVCHS